VKGRVPVKKRTFKGLLAPIIRGSFELGLGDDLVGLKSKPRVGQQPRRFQDRPRRDLSERRTQQASALDDSAGVGRFLPR
jgi:hypothetical protein